MEKNKGRINTKEGRDSERITNFEVGGNVQNAVHEFTTGDAR